jgi:hypothetical protein
LQFHYFSVKNLKTPFMYMTIFLYFNPIPWPDSISRT